jgi:hypothetical protein
MENKLASNKSTSDQLAGLVIVRWAVDELSMGYRYAMTVTVVESVAMNVPSVAAHCRM